MSSPFLPVVLSRALAHWLTRNSLESVVLNEVSCPRGGAESSAVRSENL